MRRNPTLPTIRQSISATIAKGKQLGKGKEGIQSFRKIETKILSHDEQIVKNEKIISTLANQFRLLKEQLQFQQQYNQKHKNTMNKYEEDTAKNLKVIKEQKQQIAKIELISREKDKNIEQLNKQKTALREQYEELAQTVEEQLREYKKKEGIIKALEAQLEKTKKQSKDKDAELKQKDIQLKQKEAELKEAFVSDRQMRQSKVKKLEKDIETLNIYLENNKEQLTAKDKEIQRLSLELFQTEEKIKAADRHQLKAKSLFKEVELAQRQADQLRRLLKEKQDQNHQLEVTLKTIQSKAASNGNDKVKQAHKEKKELTQRLDKAVRQIQQTKKKLQSEKKQRQKIEKRQMQSKQRITKLEGLSERLIKSKGQLSQQLGKLKSNILCDFCGKPMKNPVTNIPCGHSYCQDCKAGYLKECKKCTGVKRQAVYRNQLLDEVIQASALVQRIVLLITS